MLKRSVDFRTKATRLSFRPEVIQNNVASLKQIPPLSSIKSHPFIFSTTLLDHLPSLEISSMEKNSYRISMTNKDLPKSSKDITLTLRRLFIWYKRLHSDTTRELTHSIISKSESYAKLKHYTQLIHKQMKRISKLGISSYDEQTIGQFLQLAQSTIQQNTLSTPTLYNIHLQSSLNASPRLYTIFEKPLYAGYKPKYTKKDIIDEINTYLASLQSPNDIPSATYATIILALGNLADAKLLAEHCKKAPKTYTVLQAILLAHAKIGELVRGICLTRPYIPQGRLNDYNSLITRISSLYAYTAKDWALTSSGLPVESSIYDLPEGEHKEIVKSAEKLFDSLFELTNEGNGKPLTQSVFHAIHSGSAPLLEQLVDRLDSSEQIQELVRRTSVELFVQDGDLAKAEQVAKDGDEKLKKWLGEVMSDYAAREVAGKHKREEEDDDEWW
ncbi:hypothetical protein DAMA08_038390 [Martiniozyma asiatica (nom. inval.)]|nr:hypothetical protein DAMA08_038390 [Martiniozyma asiatica]